MAFEQDSENGPDLGSEGIALDSLVDGKMITGHVGEESVLIVRRGDEIFAIGAECTHYGGALKDGLLLGDTVRCPLHHACFSLRTGEAVRAPALNPVACWTVEQRDGRAYVTGRHEDEPLEPVSDDVAGKGKKQPEAVVIIGAGAAGSAAAEMLRRQAFQGRITMIDHDPNEPCDRPSLSKSYLSGEMSAEDCVPLRPDGFYKEHGIDLVRGKVAAIDVASRQVRMSDGSAHDYEALLLATGAEPRRLTIPGHDLPHVHVLRNFADSEAISKAAESAHRAVVMGASFIGLEVAASLRARGVEVHVVAPEKTPLAKVLGPDLGAMIKALHEEHGVIFHLEQAAASIEKDVVVLENGERLPADLVVAGIGVTPRLELAEAAGLKVDRGVVVNQYLETSVPGIYAAGDIARWPDARTGDLIRVEHWVLAQRHGQLAACNILGEREVFDTAPFFWSQHYDLSIRYVGHAEKWDSAEVSGDVKGRTFSVVYKKDGIILAVASVKRDLENLKAGVALEADDESKLEQLFTT